MLFRSLALTNQEKLFLYSESGNKEIKLTEEGTALAYHDGVVYIGTKRGNFLLLDVSTGKLTSTTTISGSKITKVVFDIENNIVAIGSSNGLLSIYNNAQGVLTSNDLKYHNMPITDIMISGQRCLTAAHERDIHIWDLGKLKHKGVVDSMM